jgi:photosystem II stability/assembly factor-like uncharacterized protein
LGLGVFRGENGGTSWEPVLDTPVDALAVHPDDAGTVYAIGNVSDMGAWGAYKSTDGGQTWTRLAVDLGAGSYVDLVINPLAPDTVYVGTDDGLYRTTDGGVTWTRAAGSLGQVSIRSLAIAAADGRTILYVGTVGGVTPLGGSARPIGPLEQMDDAYVEPGVYQMTIDHRPPVGTVYLPLLLRGG